MGADYRRRPLRALMRAITIGVAFGAMPLCLAAQGNIEFTPFVGVYLPTADLFEIRDFLVAGDKLTGKQKTTVVFGGRLGVWATNRIAFEGSFGYAPSKGEATYTDPSNVASSSDSSGHIILASGRILVGFGATGGNTLWHLIIGAGIVAHGGPAYDGASGTTDFGGIAGVGATFKVGGSTAIRLDVEDNLFSARFRDNASGVESESRFQNDLVMLVGLAVPLGGK